MMAGRKVVTFCIAFFAVGGFVGLEAPGLTSSARPAARGGVVLDDEHALADGGLGRRFVSVHAMLFVSFLHVKSNTARKHYTLASERSNRS